MSPLRKSSQGLADVGNLSESDFSRIAAIVREESGIYLVPGKERLVFGRLNKRLRALGLATFSEYCAVLESPAGIPERRNLINCITTNVTGFFRENHHFEFIREKYAADLLAKLKRNDRVRMWSAGCSNGAEPYSIALTLFALEPQVHKHDVRILATDIDTDILNYARRGRYEADALKDIPRQTLSSYFSSVGNSGQEYEIAPEVRSLVRFNSLNLHTEWPFDGAFDAIFCRNVMIYFEPQDQQTLWNRFIDRLVPGGLLFIGHSERLSTSTEARVAHRGPTIYQKMR